MQHARADAGAGSGVAGHAVRRGDERIGAVVDIEQRALRAFEQQVAAGLVRCVQLRRHVADHRTQARHQGHRVVEGLLEVDRFAAQVVHQHEVVVFQVFLQLLGEALFVEHVGDADRAARHFVFVGRADALAGGADLVFAALGFARLVDGDVVRQDDRAGFRNFQARGDFDAGGFELVDFAHHVRHGNDHAVADVAGHAFAHDARRDQLQRGFLALDDQGMAGVMAALETNDAGRMVGQPVDDFALAFIAPLGADDDDVLCHGSI